MVTYDQTIAELIDTHLKPIVKQVDEKALYAKDYIYALAKEGYFKRGDKTKEEFLLSESQIIYETAKVCMTTAFCLWCHAAALTYLRNTKNEQLQQALLPKLEAGEIIGATGLSNPMKYFSGLEDLHLKAEAVEGGYIVNGVLPAVSNMLPNHYFGAIAKVATGEVMFVAEGTTAGIEMKEKVGFAGVNGSATYAIRFTDVFIPNEQIISEDAKAFCDTIRPTFIYYQIPIGLGVIAASAEGVAKIKGKQNGCNAFLQHDADKLKAEENELFERFKQLTTSLNLKDIVNLRLDAVYATLNATQANMLHNGSAGYVEGSVPYRKLRESYFFANLTPTVRHLEKLRANLN